MATINGTFNSLIGGTISGTVGTPGPAGAQGIPGPGVPVGGSAGQFLTKTTTGVDYATNWSTLSLAGYATESWVTAGFYPISGNPSGFLTASALTPYLTKADNLGSLTNFSLARDNLGLGSLTTPTFAGLTLQGSGANVGQYTPTSLSLTHATSGSFVISPSSGITFPDTSIQTTAFVAGSGLPTGGTVGQVLTKNSGTNFDASFATLIPGDRYLTTSTTSNTLSNTNKTFTIGTGLSYTPTQSITISYDASNHMHGEVLTYNSGTGVLTVDINHHTGSGTYAAWVVNVGGVVPATSVAWGGITGVLGNQADLASALSAKLEVTTAASTYQTLSGMSNYLAKADNLSGLASTSTARTNLDLGTLATVNDAPADGSQYARKDNAWEVVSGGGGGLITSVTSPLAVTSGDLSVDLSAYAALSGASFTGPIDFSDGTQSISINLAASQISLFSAVGSAGSLFINLDGAVLSWNGLNFSSMNYSRDAIFFPDFTSQNTAGIPAAPNDGNYYVHKNGAWFQCGVTQVQGTDLNNYNVLTVP